MCIQLLIIQDSLTNLVKSGDAEIENQEYAKAVHDAYTQCVKEPERNKIRFLKNPEKDFSRERKITFSFCVRFCVQAGGGALQNEPLKYFEFEPTTPTKSAFCQQRGKTSSELPQSASA